MLKALAPDLYLKSFHALDPHALRRRGIRALLVDLDNTLALWRYGRPDPELSRWVDSLRAAGIEPCIVSNARPRRVREFAEALSIPAVWGEFKPRRRAFLRGMELLGATPAETAVLGDQLLTDILGGKRLNLFTILVVPMSPRELLWTRLVRRLERWILARLRREGLLSEPLG